MSVTLCCPILKAFGCLPGPKLYNKQSPYWTALRSRSGEMTPSRRAALAVLFVLDRPAPVRVIAAHLGVSAPTALRHCRWLAANGYAAQTEAGTYFAKRRTA